jgi:hypothetical protein
MYGKITALPVTGAGAALGSGVSVLSTVLIGLTLIMVGTVIFGLLPKLHRRSS